MRSSGLFPWRGVLALGLVTLLGCQPLRGSWYYQREPGRSPLPRECDHESRACLYLSVINDSGKTLKVTEVHVFSEPPADLPFMDDRAAFWKCVLSDEQRGHPLHPGQLIVLTLPHQRQAACVIPMDAELRVEDARSPIRVRIAANRPDSIPLAWLTCPYHRKAEPTADQTPGRCDPKSKSTMKEQGFEPDVCMPMPFKCDVVPGHLPDEPR